MVKVIAVRFKKVGKTYYFSPGEFDIKVDTPVIVETSRGIEYGVCAVAETEVEQEKIVPPLRAVIRIATPEDEALLKQNAEKEKQAMEVCTKKIADHKLDMKLVDAEYTFDGAKIIFYFTADGRVDFRELVRDLAGVFRTRIELRQIGVRDEAKMLGGLGICGKPFCCATFLDEFQPVSIKMAKEQNLSLNPTKISGTCGRLMCCLKYEQEAYEDLLRNTPTVDSVISTPEGPGIVTNVHLLCGRLHVRLDSAPDTIKVFHKSECQFSKPSGNRPRRNNGRRERNEEDNGKKGQEAGASGTNGATGANGTNETKAVSPSETKSQIRERERSDAAAKRPPRPRPTQRKQAEYDPANKPESPKSPEPGAPAGEPS